MSAAEKLRDVAFRMRACAMCNHAQEVEAIAATLGRPKAKSHPYGYEPDTGAFDATRCECGCINDISATYCNDCGGEIEIDMNAEKEIYHTPAHMVFVEKHDVGSLEFAGKRYIAATLGRGTCEWPTDMEGQRIQIADTIHMLRTEYDGDHEWEDVVIELAYVEHGGDKWVVRGARGEAWACECTVTGHDDELYDNSGDWSNLPTPWDRPEPDGWYKCHNPSCGCVVGYSLLADDSWTIYMDDYQIPFNHCPQCGKAVKR